METTEVKEEIVRDEKPVRNCCTSTINISYQIVLQDHNYGAPPPQDFAPNAIKQEPKAEFHAGLPHTSPVGRANDSNKGPKTPNARSGTNGGPPTAQSRTPKLNGVNSVPPKQGKIPNNSISGGGSQVANQGNAYNKAGFPLLTLPSVHQLPIANPGLVKVPGDLNSRLYASVEKTEEPKVSNGNPPPAAGGLVGFLGNINEWLSRERLQERAKARAELPESYHHDSDDSLDLPLVDTDHDGEETETAPECEGEEEDLNQEESITRCICKFGHDDGYMICCDRCSVWQHVDCMGLDRTNIPDEYLCEQCHPRRIDRARARAVQYRKRQEFRLSTPPPAGNSGRDRNSNNRKDEMIDVEKTPRKLSGKSKVAANKTVPNKNLKGSAADPLKGRKVGHQKWKRKTDKLLEDNDKEKNHTPRKRKMSRAKSSEGLVAASAGEVTPSKGAQAAELLLQWIEHYEEAVTNHYSPELRARVATVRPTSSNVPFVDTQFTAPSTEDPVYRIGSKQGGYKTLEAARSVRAGDPIIEVRGKYMLTNQLRPYKTGDSGSGSAGVRPSPHILYIQLYGNSDASSPAPVIDVCVDGRSYGNDARFAWQSCRPNAEVKLSIEKGSVHLYLVAKMNISEGDEITLGHETRNPLSCNYESCPYLNARTVQRDFNKAIAAANSEKRRRRRTNSAAGSASAAAGVPAASASPAGPVAAPVVTVAAESSPVATEAPVRTPPPQGRRSSNSAGSPVKKQPRIPPKTPPASGEEPLTTEADTSYEERNSNEAESSSHKDKKMSREERKMEAIMKAFERMEKAQQRRQEAQSKQTHRKDRRDSKDGASGSRDEDFDVLSGDHDEQGANERRSLAYRKRKRGGRVRRSSSTSLHKTRVRALSGEIQSGQSTAEDENQDDINDYASTSFRCPKTKKVVFNTWVADAEGNIMKSEQQDTSSSQSAAVPVCYMRNPISRSPTRSQRPTLRTSTIVSLKPGGADSPDQFSLVSLENQGEDNWAAPAAGSAGGSAKKRWLRQAISEETETDPASGNAAQDHVTPLKKRRFARASLSSETSFTPPSTPTQFCGFNEATPPEAYGKEEQLTSSQSTTPECEDLPEVRNAEPEIETVDEQELLDIPLPEAGNDEAEANPTFFNGFHGTAFLPAQAAAVIGEVQGSEAEVAKPTWEFRAPDAQFMRTRTSSESCEVSQEQAASSPLPEDTPKPAKRKLSILEYRKRKQRLHSEDGDGPGDEPLKPAQPEPATQNETETNNTPSDSV